MSDYLYDVADGHCFGPDGEPISLREWERLFGLRAETLDVPESWWRKQTTIDGVAQVSTVWLGLDQRFGLPGPPLIWEAMIFGGGEADGDQYRYATRGEAFDHHEQLVRELRAESTARVADRDDDAG